MFIISVLFVLLLIAIILIGFENFTQHRNTVVRQQQEHLLTIARFASRSLDTYFDDKVDSLSVLAQNPIVTGTLIENKNRAEQGRYEEVIKDFYKKCGDETKNVSLFDAKGNLIYQYPDGINKNETLINNTDINNVLKNKEGTISKEFECSLHEFSMNILEPVMINGDIRGVLVSTINLNRLYESLIAPIRSGKKGYAMIKNREGIIVMHPVLEQIGIESIKVRKERFPKLNWKELEDLHRKQLEQQEGYHIYHSGWWQDNEIKLIKKVNAYTTFQTSSTSWIISVQMDYSEIEGPIRGTLINISVIAILITVFLLIIAYIIFKIDKKRKALEIETKYLHELNKTWNELVKSEARLRHSQKLQTIGVLTSGIAHEFRNLLAPVLGYSELLLDRVNGKYSKDDIIEDLMEIKKSASKGAEIIEQLLAFSRNDNGPIKIRLLKIEEVIRESIKLVRPVLPGNIKITGNFSSNDLILGSATQLEQVLLNLYTNSYHAMKTVGGTIEINVDREFISADKGHESRLPEGMYVKIQTKDNGIGMTEEILSQIFNPFFTTKETGEGSGLGLSVVQGIIKDHKGAIIIKSSVSEGTTVDIYLPAAQDNEIVK
jgi:signal transduction histidine kinase